MLEQKLESKLEKKRSKEELLVLLITGNSQCSEARKRSEYPESMQRWKKESKERKVERMAGIEKRKRESDRHTWRRGPNGKEWRGKWKKLKRWAMASAMRADFLFMVPSPSCRTSQGVGKG